MNFQDFSTATGSVPFKDPHCSMCHNEDLISVVRTHDYINGVQINIDPIRGYECHHCTNKS